MHRSQIRVSFAEAAMGATLACNDVQTYALAPVTLDHFVMVRIHARQPVDALSLAHGRPSDVRLSISPAQKKARRLAASHALSKPQARRMGWLRYTVGI